MNDLIKIDTNATDRPTVMGRELHKALEIKTPYKKWFDRMCEYGFAENTDFVTMDKNVRRADGTEMPQLQFDHQLTIDMAKEICMIQRTEVGRKCRQYFLDVEKQWNSPEAIMHRALALADQKVKQLEMERANRPITAEQEKQLRNEVIIKAIDLCVCGRVYLAVGIKVRIAIDNFICDGQNVRNMYDLAVWQFDSALEMCRKFKPDKELRAMIDAERKSMKGDPT